jgi:hypothetical protein
MKNVNLDALNVHLFETIEMLKNNSDEKASDNEKIDIATAKAIADLGRVIVDGYKIKAHVLSVLTKTGTYDQNDVKSFALEIGINS